VDVVVIVRALLIMVMLFMQGWVGLLLLPTYFTTTL
jgi:hypothetical protein